MEFRAKRGDFLATLYWTQNIVERRNTMPILANVLIEAQGETIQVTATDLEVGLRGKLPGDISKGGAITVNARKLYEIVREAPDETLEVKGLENDWVEIKSGKSVFKIVGMDPKEFPQFPSFAGKNLSALPGNLLREMIDRTIFSVSSDETRYSLNGVFIEKTSKGMVRMVATDGHRLALIEKTMGDLGLEKGVILPRKGLAELRKLLEQKDDGTISIGFQENMGWAAKEPVELFMRLIDGDFPDYDKVIPKGNPFVARADQTALLHALRRVSILSSERYKGIKIDLREGRMSISANNPDLGEAVEEIEVDYKGKPLAVGFNARYLIDVLSVIGEGGDVEIELKDELSPSLIRKAEEEGYIYVIMPMRL
ncbi:MAG: DNA polymerase III subunit beta [Deltaproteobacteria bacterium]|nr:DNA polymerase III subunit beta [Deltaproteobacteria bacterium]